MRTHAIFAVTLTFGAGLALAQHGVGRGAAMPAGAAAHGQAHGQMPGNAATSPSISQAAVATRLDKNPALATRLAPLLPAGVTAQQAAGGFKNWGQFVAALQVSKNLNIPFSDLKAQMTGTQQLSLGKAIHQLRPELQEDYVRVSVRTAEREAKELERGAGKISPAVPTTTE